MDIIRNKQKLTILFVHTFLTALVLTPAAAFGRQTPANQQPPPDQSNHQQPLAVPAAEPPPPGQIPNPNPGKTEAGEDKYIFGVLPNYRTAEMNAIGHPLTATKKLEIATKDSFAWPLVGIGAAYALLYQAENSHPEFGQGVEGYAKRFGTSYSDQVIGNFMTEGIFPSILKQDPRYFRMAHGSVGKRTWYAVSRILVTRTDGGRSTINASELLGNAAASAIGLAYYPEDRDVPDYLQNWGIQLGTDAVSQMLKEFWPDVKHWWRKRRADENPPMSEVPPGNSR